MNKLLSLPDSFLGLFYNFGYSWRFVLLPALYCHVCLELLSWGMWWEWFWRFRNVSRGTSGCGCSPCQVQLQLLRAVPSLILEQLCTGAPGWEWAQRKTKLWRERKRILSWSGTSQRSKISCIAPTTGAARELGLSGWSRGKGMGVAAPRKMPWELSVEPQPSFQ